MNVAVVIAYAVCIDTSVRIHLTQYNVISIKNCLNTFVYSCFCSYAFHFISFACLLLLFYFSSVVVIIIYLHQYSAFILFIIHESFSIYTNHIKRNKFQQKLTFIHIKTHTHTYKYTHNHFHRNA